MRKKISFTAYLGILLLPPVAANGVEGFVQMFSMNYMIISVYIEIPVYVFTCHSEGALVATEESPRSVQEILRFAGQRTPASLRMTFL